VFEGEQATGSGTETVETTRTSEGVATPARPAVAERVDGIPAVPAVPEGIRRAAGIDDTTPGELAETEPSVAAGDAAELARLRELVLAANSDVVPELVVGGSLDELLTSVETAKAAYGRVEERVKAAQPAAAAPAEVTPVVPVVPAGGGVHVADVDNLAPRSKIARALDQQRRKGRGE
jgi:hypothetical protein